MIATECLGREDVQHNVEALDSDQELLHDVEQRPTGAVADP